MPKRKKAEKAENPTVLPWDAPGLERWERVIVFCESLPVTSGKLAGTQWRARPWQRRWIKKVYRTDRKGRRIVRTAVLSLARKNGKSDLAARLTLCHFCGPESEPRGECYAAANDRAQAGRIFSEMAAIIEQTEWMRTRVSIRRHEKQMEDIGEGGTGSIFAALSSDVPSKHGLSPSFFVVDELGQAPNRDLLDVLDSATGARSEPLGLVISTQAPSDAAPLSQLIDYGLRVQRKEIRDDSFLLEFFSAPLDLDPWSPATWKLANPALGDFRDLEDVKRLAAQAQRMPAREPAFRNLILNQRVDATPHFLTPAIWNACGGAVDVDELEGRPCFAGLDLGSTRDLTSLTLIFPDDDDVADVLAYFWLPNDTLAEREEIDRAPYQQWKREGHLLTTPGKSCDPKAVALAIAELHGRFKIRALAFDRWRIQDLRRELDGIGCDVPLIECGQGFRDMSVAVDELERRAVDGKLRHGGHPVLTYCVSNVKIESDAANNRKFSKVKSIGHIDGAVALGMACRTAKSAPPPPKQSVYLTRGLIAV